MDLTYLQEFFRLTEPLQHLWRSASFSGYAAKINDVWILLGGRITLSDALLEAERLEKLADFDTFFAFSDILPMESFPGVVREIVETENVHMHMGGNRGFRDIALHLKEGPSGSNTLSSFPPRKFDKNQGQSSYGINAVGFEYLVRNDWWIQRLIGPELLETANGLLRLHSHINGLEALAKQQTPGLHVNANRHPEFQVLAPLPFQLDYEHNVGVRLVAPPTVDISRLRIKVFFSSHSAQERLLDPMNDRLSDRSFAITWNFTWPEGVNNAEIRLFYCDRDIDGLVVNRWAASASIRGAIDEYFDTDHTLLKRALEWQTDKNSQDNFEWAIIRMLNLLGIPAIWYGKLADSGRPDGAAIVFVDHSPLVLLIECTLEKPANKFGPLSERARKVKEHIKCDAEILPVVFNATSISSADLTAAFEHGVSTLGAAEIAELFGLVTSPNATSELVIDYLRRYAAKGSSVLSAINNQS